MVGLAAVFASSGSPAMNMPGKETFGRCTIVGGTSLPSTSGGSEALCRIVEAAIKAKTQTRDYAVEVKVMSPSRISASLVVKGHELPEQRFAVMDGVISPGSIQRFAESLARVVADAAN
jgi:hypothetical protein